MSYRPAHAAPGGRRRRLLVIRQADERRKPAAIHPLESGEPRPSFESHVSASSAVDVGPPLNDVMAIASDGLEVSIRQPASVPCSRLQARLRQPTELIWLIAGDSLEPLQTSQREWRSFGGRLTEHVRNRLNREQDMFVVSAAAGRCLANVASEVDRQILRFQPDIVLLGIGPHEAGNGQSGLHAFERSLLTIINAISECGAILCLQTPPLTPVESQRESIDRLIYVEAIRAIAAEYDLPLIDHYVHWESVATEIGGLERWFDGVSGSPGRIGHEQLARRIIAELGLEGSGPRR